MIEEDKGIVTHLYTHTHLQCQHLCSHLTDTIRTYGLQGGGLGDRAVCVFIYIYILVLCSIMCSMCDIQVGRSPLQDIY